MKNSIITAFEQRVFKARKQHPGFRTGDTVRVMYKLQEGSDKSKFRLQSFEGVVIRFRENERLATAMGTAQKNKKAFPLERRRGAFQ